MKKKIFSFAIAGLVCLGLHSKVSAQRGASYQNAIGLFIDAGNGGTLVGPHFKHFFNSRDAGQIMVLFGNNWTRIGAEYSYNAPISGANGLKWNIGVGPQVGFYSNQGYSQTDFFIRPMVGLEYKVPQVPIAFGFDWRPDWALTHGSNFEAGRFGIAFKYAF
ncbi:MAG: hypothetical protein QM610_04215 [Chitinophagaceae bacterium]